jgi:ankyrin repeat protein
LSLRTELTAVLCASGIQELIELGVPVLTFAEKGWTPLHFAALNGNEVRTDPNPTDLESSTSSSSSSSGLDRGQSAKSKRCAQELVVVLLAGGAADRYRQVKAKAQAQGDRVDSLNVTNTPLMWAASKGYVSVSRVRR